MDEKEFNEMLDKREKRHERALFYMHLIVLGVLFVFAKFGLF